MPSTNTNGKNTAMVVNVDAMMAIDTSLVPMIAACLKFLVLALC